MTQKVFNVEGMSCSHCVKAVTKALEALDGVASAKVELEARTAAVEFDAAKVSDAQIRAAIEEEGYEVKN
ncbi:MAG: copper chaperone CopZ [Synergistaceae bacterium]|jgi:copper ion binding protein|nr:copper chaperone CopZ [Synergistaceae bacterium]